MTYKPYYMKDVLDNSNKEIINKALLWGSLSIYLADKKFSKDQFFRGNLNLSIAHFPSLVFRNLFLILNLSL